MSEMLARAATIADEVLLPAASEVDRTGTIPEEHFKVLAEEGFYGLVAPVEHGGPGVGFTEFGQIVEVLASGCLTTAFTWLQHHGVVMGLAMSPNAALRESHLARAASGALRGGGAFSGVLPDPPRLVATRAVDGWTISGDVPLVSGWGLVDVLHVSAHHPETDQIVSGLVEAREGAGIVGVVPLELVAGQGSRTVRLRIRDLHLPDTAVTTCTDRRQFLDGLVLGLRIDSALPLGLAGRATALLDEAGHGPTATALRAELTAVRADFDAAMGEPHRMPGLRAAASELAHRACGALVVAVGGSALVCTHEAQRLARESLFTLVAASRSQVKSALLQRLVPAGSAQLPNGGTADRGVGA